MNPIVPMSERVYREIPICQIRVLNSRNRDKEQFEQNIISIEKNGLLKPVVVNERNQPSLSYYELVCGEGRLNAMKKIGHEVIQAEIINVDNKTALLFSLVENIARLTPGTIWFAREVLRMKESGFSVKRIAEIAGKSDWYINQFLQLMRNGEERLIVGVERGLFPMSFAFEVSKAKTEDIQHILMDAFDNGIINSCNTSKVRSFIERRMGRKRIDQSPSARNYTFKELKSDIQQATEDSEAYTRQAEKKENRMLAMTESLGVLLRDEIFVMLLKKHNLQELPQLKRFTLEHEVQI